MEVFDGLKGDDEEIVEFIEYEKRPYVAARWSGSTHDQIMFDNCYLKRRLENGKFANSLLVADSGYADTLFVITPLLTRHSEIDQLYNEAVTRSRNPVEHQYGVWKRRFHVLALGLRLKLETTLQVIVAVGVLYNIALTKGKEEPPLDADVNLAANINYVEDIIMDPPEYHNFRNTRDILLNDYFPRLLKDQQINR